MPGAASGPSAAGRAIAPGLRVSSVPGRPASVPRSNLGQGSDSRPVSETGRDLQSEAGSWRRGPTCRQPACVTFVRPTYPAPGSPRPSRANAGTSARADFGNVLRRLYSMLAAPNFQTASLLRPPSRRTFRRWPGTNLRHRSNWPPLFGNVLHWPVRKYRRAAQLPRPLAPSRGPGGSLRRPPGPAVGEDEGTPPGRHATVLPLPYGGQKPMVTAFATTTSGAYRPESASDLPGIAPAPCVAILARSVEWRARSARLRLAGASAKL